MGNILGSITIVNLTDSSIQSAIANTGSIYSGINGLLPNAYYRHDALKGTGYDVWERWYVPGISEEFPQSDLSKIGWYVGAAAITLLGIIATAITAGALAPAAATGIFAADMLADLGIAAAGAAINNAAISLLSAQISLGIGTVAGITGLGVTVGSPVVDYLASSKKSITNGPVWGQDHKILTVTGQIPLTTCQVTDCEGHGLVLAKIPTGTTAKTALPPTFGKELTAEEFDMMRRDGKIYQIKHRDGEYCDMTQGLVRMNLRGGGGKENRVTSGGMTLDISRLYRIQLQDFNSYLTAGGDEGDHRVYLRDDNYDLSLPCCYWQCIPTREHGGGWIFVDRLSVRALYWSGSAMLQYASETLGISIGPDGWATNVKLPGMVWNFSSPDGSLQGSIEQPGKDRICVAAHNTSGSDQIDGISFNNQNALQKWSIKVVADGSDFKNPMKISGYVYLQNDKRRLVNDEFAGTRNQSRPMESFYLRILPDIPNLKLEYMAYIENFGNTPWVKEGVTVRNNHNRIKGFAVRLIGTDAAKYRVSYMAHLSHSGDTDFYSNGEFCGYHDGDHQVEGMLVHLEKL